MTINDMMQKAFWDTDIPDHPAQAWEQGYQKGANDVLNEIERLFVNGESWCTIGENIQRMIKYLKKGE